MFGPAVRFLQLIAFKRLWYFTLALDDLHHLPEQRVGNGSKWAPRAGLFAKARMQEALVDAEAVIAFGGPKNLDADQPAQ